MGPPASDSPSRPPDGVAGGHHSGSSHGSSWKLSLPSLSTDRSRPSTANRDVSSLTASPTTLSPSPSPMSSLASAFSMKKRLSDSITDSWSRRRPSLQQGSSSSAVPSTPSRLKDASSSISSYAGSSSSKSRSRSSSATTAAAVAAATTSTSTVAATAGGVSSSSTSLTSSRNPSLPPLNTSASRSTIASASSSASSFVGGGGGGGGGGGSSGISRQGSYSDIAIPRSYHMPPTHPSSDRIDRVDSPTHLRYDGIRTVASRPIAGSEELRENTDNFPTNYWVDSAAGGLGGPYHTASQKAAADVGMGSVSVPNLTRKISNSRRIMTGPLPEEEEDAQSPRTTTTRRIFTKEQLRVGVLPSLDSKRSSLADSNSTVRGYEIPSSDDESSSSSMVSYQTKSSVSSRAGMPQGYPQYRRRTLSRTAGPQDPQQHGADAGTVPPSQPPRSLTASPVRPGMTPAPSRSLMVTPSQEPGSRVSSVGNRDGTATPSRQYSGVSGRSATSTVANSSSVVRSDSNSSAASTADPSIAKPTGAQTSANPARSASRSARHKPSGHHHVSRSRTRDGPTVVPPPVPDPEGGSSVDKAPASGMYWYKAPTHGIRHEPIRAHSCTAIGSSIYVFGGCGSRTSFNDMYIFDADAMSWSKPQVSGQIPPPLRAMTTTAVGRKLVIFGGGDGPTYYNDIYIFDTVTFRYSKPAVVSEVQPCRRRAHTACFYKNGIYIFGGGDGVKALNDVWRLDVTNLDKPYWELISAPSDPKHPSGELKPTPRGYHTANMVGSKLIIYGGSDGEDCFKDVWVFDADTRLWKCADIKKSYSRLSHTATMVGSYLFVVGGHDGVEYSSEVLLLNVVTMQWDRRKVYGVPPCGRGYHCAVLYDSRLFIIGGFDGQQVFNDTYILELAVSSYYSQISHFTVIANP